MKEIGHKELTTIIKGCIALDRSYQRRLYDLLFPNVVKSITAHNLAKQEVEDLIQETFIKIFNHITNYDIQKSSIYTWSSIIAKRLTINFLQSKYNKTIIAGLTEVSEKFYVEIEFKDDFEIQLILDSIKRLPDMYKKVFEMAVIHGMEHKKISIQLGISPSTSRVYLTRAKTLLKNDMNRIGINL